MSQVRSFVRPFCLIAVIAFALTQLSNAQFGGVGGGFGGGSASESKPAAGCAGPGSAKPAKTIKPIDPRNVSSPANPYFPIPSDREQELTEKLNGIAELSFNDQPLTDAVSYFADFYKMFVRIDREALEEEGIGVDTPLTFQVSADSKMPLRTALNLILNPVRLAAINEDGILTITTQAKKTEFQITRTYPISDLTDPEQSETYDELIEVLTTTTRGPWLSIDGEGGTMTASQTLRTLVVRTTRQVHEEIEVLLAALRAARDTQ